MQIGFKLAARTRVELDILFVTKRSQRDTHNTPTEIFKTGSDHTHCRKSTSGLFRNLYGCAYHILHQHIVKFCDNIPIYTVD